MWTDSAEASMTVPPSAMHRPDRCRVLADRTVAAAAGPARPTTKTDLRAVLDAIFYLLRTGCQWRLLPKCFPPRSTVFGNSAAGGGTAPCSACTTRCWSWHARPRAVRRNRPPASSTANRSGPAKASASAATMPARRSTAASATSWSTRWACCCAASFIPPASRTATGWPRCSAHPPPLPLARPDLRRRRLSGRSRGHRGRDERLE